MKISSPNRSHALTWIEVLIILGVAIILAALFLHGLARANARSSKINCINNVKQVGLAFRIWAGDHNEKFPMQVSTNDGGTMEFVGSPNDTYRHFLVMSNEVNTPKILYCPQESDAARLTATTFAESAAHPTPGTVLFSGNRNISYFVGVDALDINPGMFLSGDRNITNSLKMADGILLLVTNRPAWWSHELHNRKGNLGLTDGSVMSCNSRILQSLLVNTGTATNRLAMP